MRNDSDPRVAATTDSCRAALGLDSRGRLSLRNPDGSPSPHEQRKIVLGLLLRTDN